MGNVSRFVRALKLLTKSGPLFTIAATTAVLASGQGPIGLLGALLGLILQLAALQIGTLTGALIWRLRIRHIIIGVGRELRAWNTPNLRIVLRSLPVVIMVGARSIHSPVRKRLWLTGATSVLAAILTATTTWLLATGELSRGLAIGATTCLLHELIPRRSAGTTSPGWFLFSLPRLSGRPAAEMDATPLVNNVVDAIRTADLDTADTALAKLVEAHPALLMTTGAQATMLNIRGKYAEALQLLSALVGRPDMEPRDMALILAEMAGATASAVEAGQLPLEIGLSAGTRAADSAIGFGLPRYRLTGTLAQLALLRGDTTEALSLARQSADSSTDALARADSLATAARAQMAAGDNSAARTTLAEAESLAAWLPRVTTTSARLKID
ncbi:hypothetical protein [Umezawaea sp. Da 62-37]|uniref:hypothetical protein n=1 Tax=Umezawaea sp. Da 62-37 TaxID=3075927 RepID=UPI0028F6DAE4|nr:hypothetical protein [Umezawaea sp. Da 62-37]WNV90075.1 hypothetical protein RM788_17785 [Umezawaea sp. Da 62-37]